MKFGLVTLATLVSLAASIPAFAATAPKEDFTPVPRSVINAGPVADGSDWWSGAQAEHQYFAKVCPTVMHAPTQYQPSVVRFCEEPIRG